MESEKPTSEEVQRENPASEAEPDERQELDLEATLKPDLGSLTDDDEAEPCLRRPHSYVPFRASSSGAVSAPIAAGLGSSVPATTPTLEATEPPAAPRPSSATIAETGANDADIAHGAQASTLPEDTQSEASGGAGASSASPRGILDDEWEELHARLLAVREQSRAVKRAETEFWDELDHFLLR